MKIETLEYQRQEIGNRWRYKFLDTPGIRIHVMLSILLWLSYLAITREAGKNKMTVKEWLDKEVGHQ